MDDIFFLFFSFLFLITGSVNFLPPQFFLVLPLTDIWAYRPLRRLFKLLFQSCSFAIYNFLPLSVIIPSLHMRCPSHVVTAVPSSSLIPPFLILLRFHKPINFLRKQFGAAFVLVVSCCCKSQHPQFLHTNTQIAVEKPRLLQFKIISFYFGFQLLAHLSLSFYETRTSTFERFFPPEFFFSNFPQFFFSFAKQLRAAALIFTMCVRP